MRGGWAHQQQEKKKKNEVLQGLTSSYAATNPGKEGKDKGEMQASALGVLTPCFNIETPYAV